MAHCFSFPPVCVTGTSLEAWLDILTHQLETFSAEPLFFFCEGHPDAFLWDFLRRWCTQCHWHLCWMKKWCSWQPRNLKCCVKTNHIVAIRGFEDWLPRSPLDHNSSSSSVVSALMHGDVCRSSVHRGSELSLRVLCDCWQTLCPWQWKCYCLLPLNNGPGTLSLPANCLACSLNHPSFSPQWKTSEASRQVPWPCGLQYLDCILFLQPMQSKQ